MTLTEVLFLVGGSIVVAMLLYLIRLWRILNQQQRDILQAQQQRQERLKESIEIIAKAMLSGDCDLSEGVLRLKMLLEPLGRVKLQAYPAMFELYQVVQDMPTHEARKQLTKKERMRQDLTRESAEAKLESQIKLELPQLIEIINKG